MFKKFVSVALVLSLIFSSCAMVFAHEPEVDPRANMVTYHTLNPLVGKASDYTTLIMTKNSNIGLQNKIVALGVAGVVLAISKNSTVSKYVVAAIDKAMLGAAVYAVYKAYDADYASDLFCTIKEYEYNSNGPFTYAFKYVTTFYADSARKIPVYTTTEYYTYVI